MTNINKAYGNFRTNENFMILSRQYEMDDSKGKIADMTTYIDPSLYNNIFADQSFDAQNFWVQIGVNIKARRLMLSLIHISEPTRLGMISYAVFCLKKKKQKENNNSTQIERTTHINETSNLNVKRGR